MPGTVSSHRMSYQYRDCVLLHNSSQRHETKTSVRVLHCYIPGTVSSHRMSYQYRDCVLLHNSSQRHETKTSVRVLHSYHLHQRRFRRIYLSTNPSPHDPQNLLLAQANRPMKTPGRIFSIIPSCQSD